jgi:hypothetical protein
MFRRALTKDIELASRREGSKLFMGGPGLSACSDEELSKFFSDEERAVIKAAQAEGQIVKTHVISDSSVDRHHDTVNVDGWDTGGYNDIVQLNHGHIGFAGVRETTIPVAKSLKTWKYAGKLKSTAMFTPKDVYPFGHMVGQLVDQGYMKGCSVGFIPKAWEEDPERKDRWGYPAINFKEQELVEYSIVQVGSNRNALVEEGLQDTIEQALSFEQALDAAKSSGIDTTPVAQEMERILDEDKPESMREFAERLFFAHKSGILFPVSESPTRNHDDESFVADVMEIING